jgi:hypothetical protein
MPAVPAAPVAGAKLDRAALVGKWLLGDGVIDFQSDGTFVNVGDKHKWELDGSTLVLTFSGKPNRVKAEIVGDRLSWSNENGRSAIHALRLDTKTLGAGNGWTAADLAGDWKSGDEYSFKIDADGKGGFCSTQIRQGATNVVNFESAIVKFTVVDEIRIVKIQGHFWVIRLTDEKKTLELISGDGSAFKPNTIKLTRK